MNKPNVLIVDDDMLLLQALSAGLHAEFNIFTAVNLTEARARFSKEKIDLILSDYYISTETGLEFSEWIQQKNPWCPFLLMSSRFTVDILKKSFDCRVVAVVEKPATLEDITGKINSELKRSKFKADEFQSALSDVNFKLDLGQRLLQYDGEIINLTQTETKILESLVLNKGNVVKRSHLVEKIWGQTHVSENTLDTHFTNLKKKAPFLREQITGIHGIGYVLNGKV